MASADSRGGQGNITSCFVCNWATTTSWKSDCRRLALELQDGQRDEAVFRVR